MARYLLDSNAVTDLFDDRENPVSAALRGHVRGLSDDDELCVSVLSLYEAEYGIALAPTGLREGYRAKIVRTIEACSVLPLRAEDSRAFGHIKARVAAAMGKEGVKKRTADCAIAATALGHGCALVSADTDFALISNAVADLAAGRDADAVDLFRGKTLLVENWASG